MTSESHACRGPRGCRRIEESGVKHVILGWRLGNMFNLIYTNAFCFGTNRTSDEHEDGRLLFLICLEHFDALGDELHHPVRFVAGNKLEMSRRYRRPAQARATGYLYMFSNCWMNINEKENYSQHLPLPKINTVHSTRSDNTTCRSKARLRLLAQTPPS